MQVKIPAGNRAIEEPVPYPYGRSVMQRIAIIDVGSNSARLVISHIYKSGSYNMVFNQKEMLRLAQKTEGDGLLSKEAFDSTLQVMQSFAYMCRQYKTDKIIAVATAAIRNARNGSQLAKEVFEKTGIRLHIISGNMEAQLSYLGVINTLPMKDGIVFDLGGGSTELILFRNRKLVESVSIPLGAVNTTDIFHIRDTMPSSAYSDINFFISTRMEQYPWLKDANLPLIGVGGTARTVAKMIQRSRNYPSSRVHNYIYSAQSFRALFKKLQGTTLEERRNIPGLSEERADIILAGASIINCLLTQTNSKRIVTSGCGLREGLFYDDGVLRVTAFRTGHIDVSYAFMLEAEGRKERKRTEDKKNSVQTKNILIYFYSKPNPWS